MSSRTLGTVDGLTRGVVCAVVLACAAAVAPPVMAAGVQWTGDSHRFRYENAYRRTMKAPGQSEQTALLRVRADFELRLKTGATGRTTGKAVLSGLELGTEAGKWTRVERIPGAVSQVAVHVGSDGRVHFTEALVAFHHARRFWLVRAPTPSDAMPYLPRDPTRILSSVAAEVHPRTGAVVSADSAVGRRKLRGTKVPVIASMIELLPREVLAGLPVPVSDLAAGTPGEVLTAMLRARAEPKETIATTVKFTLEGEGVTPEPEENDKRALRGGVRTHVAVRGTVDTTSGRLNLLAGALDVAAPFADAGLVTTHSAFSLARR